MTKFAKFLVVCLLVSLVAAGCGQAGGGEEASWLENAQLGEYAPETQDWAAIEAAALEEGTVIVYANSSRIEREIELFQEAYPGITLQGYDLGGDDVITKVREEQAAQAYIGDVWFSSGGPEIFGEFLPNQQLWPFVPDEFVSVIPPESRNPFVVARYGVRVLGYNTELNPDGCPITNFWQLTEPEWSGRVFIEDPLADASTMGILTTIVQHADELEAAYVEYYGSEPVLDEDTPDAGWLWLKRFAQNQPIMEPGGDEVVQAFSTPGMTEAGVGFTSYSKYRDTVSGELVFDACRGLEPVMGVRTAAYIAIINGAPHPNAAKLFIRFALDQGFAPWNVIGDYSPRTDIPAPEGAIPREELDVWSQDDAYIYDNVSAVRDFWTLNLLQP